MGYLISPISFRLGWYLNWVDDWFVDYHFYPQYLHAILKIRLFLTWFLNLNYFRSLDMIYSHFKIVKFLKNLNIYIFFYHGSLEKFLENYFLESSIDFFRYRWRHKFFFNMQGYFRILITFGALCDFAFPKISYSSIVSLVRVLRSHNLKKLSRLLYLKEKQGKKKVYLFSEMKHETKLRFFFFYSVFLLINKSLFFYKSESNCINYHSLKQLLFVYIYYFFFKDNFSLLKNNIGLLLKHLFGIGDCLINFLIISNYNINANFLSRYLAFKIKQRYSIKELMNPLLKEINRIKDSWFINTSLHRRDIYKSKKLETQLTMFKGYIKRFTSAFSAYYVQQNLLYYQQVKFWFNFEDFLFLYWLNKNFKLLKKRKIGWSLKYFKFKSFFCFFFSTNSYYLLNELEKLFNVSIFFGFAKIANYSFLVEIFCNEFWYKYNQLFFDYPLSRVHYKFFLIAEDFYRRIICRIIKKKERLKKDIHAFFDKPRYSDFITGFKFQFLGRFTRKQKTAKITYRHGSTPFSTMIANVDYATYSVPVKNSVVNVKVWLFYKHKTRDEYFFKI